MKNISGKSCRENRNTHFMFNYFFPPESCAVHEIMWKNVALGRPQMTIGACGLHAWYQMLQTHTQNM